MISDGQSGDQFNFFSFFLVKCVSIQKEEKIDLTLVHSYPIFFQHVVLGMGFIDCPQSRLITPN